MIYAFSFSYYQKGFYDLNNFETNMIEIMDNFSEEFSEIVWGISQEQNDKLHRIFNQLDLVLE